MPRGDARECKKIRSSKSNSLLNEDERSDAHADTKALAAESFCKGGEDNIIERDDDKRHYVVGMPLLVD